MPRRLFTALPLITLGVASALMLSACAGGSSARTSTPVADGTITYGHQQEPACVFGGWVEQAYLSYNVLDSLVSLGEDGKPVAWLAETWSQSDDGLTWTFNLKKGVKFTDGTPLTAAVVAYNFDYWVKGGNSTAQVWLGGYYRSAKAVDDLTLEVALAKPYRALAETLTQGYFGIQSQQALTTRTEEQNCEAPIGTGAFTVEKWNRGQDIILARNDNYTSWSANAKVKGPAKVERVDWKFISDPTTRVASLRSGETDAIYDVPAIEWAGVGKDGYQLEKYVTGGRPQQLSFNTQVGPFTDENVRKAFAYSLDRKTIVDTIGRGVIPYDGNGPVSQSTPGYSKKAANWYDYDTAKANKLLDAAGWTGRDSAGYRTKDGTSLKVVLPYGAGSIINTDGAAILQGVQEQAKAVGFKVDLVPVPQSEFFAGAYSKPEERDIAVGYWTAVTAGILYINWRPSTADSPNYWNDAFYNSTELESSILEGNSAPTVDAQKAAFEKAQEFIADHALSIGLYDRLSTLAVNPKLKDVWQEHSQGGPVFHDAYFTE
jgi:peptide/nickel transport system substrate-binding protein